jgi:hypothetical protein
MAEMFGSEGADTTRFKPELLTDEQAALATTVNSFPEPKATGALASIRAAPGLMMRLDKYGSSYCRGMLER